MSKRIPAPTPRRVEDAFPPSAERFRLLVESVRDYAIYILDPNGTIVTWNVGAERLKGYSADEVIGQHFSKFYPPEDVAAGKPEREMEQARSHGRSEDEGWRLRKDGSRFWASVVLTALRAPDGTLTGFAKVTRDLTERRAAEEDRIRRAQAEEALRLRDEFLSIASHELRTPLSSLRIQTDGLARALGRGEGAVPHEKLVARLSNVRAELDRIEGLVHDLLDVSRVSAGRLELRCEEMDLAAFATEVVQRFDEAAQHAGSVVTVIAPAPVVGRWDRGRIEQVLVNLLTNALKYGRGAPIEVAVAGDQATARLRVRDYGIGIDAAEQDRIFNRFERAADARHFGGFGLGLWITRRIVEAHGGTVSVESAPSAGATFTVELPRGG